MARLAVLQSWKRVQSVPSLVSVWWLILLLGIDAWLQHSLVTVLVVFMAAAASVSGAMWFAVPEGEETQVWRCDIGTFRDASVEFKARIAIDGLEYPRVSGDLIIRVPLSAPGAGSLLAGTRDPAGRKALGCLLGFDRSSFEVRDAQPAITLVDDVVTVTEHAYVDLAGLRNPWVSLAHVVIGSEGSPWTLSVHSPPGLRFAKWNVSVAAPDGWLSAPVPWREAQASDSELRWEGLVPTASRDGALLLHYPERFFVVTSAKVLPDIRSTVTLAATDRRWKPITWGWFWLSALVFAVAALWHLRLRGRSDSWFESTDRRDARRAVGPLAYVVVLTGVLAVLDVILTDIGAPDKIWHAYAWSAGGVLFYLVCQVAMRWWVRRSVALVVYTSVLAAVVANLVAHDADGGWLPGVVAAASSFLITLLLVVAAGTALHVLLRRTSEGGFRASPPRWLWLSGAVFSGVLILEEAVIQRLNFERRAWLDLPAGPLALREIYLYYPLDVLDEMTWLMLLVVAVAVWRHHARHSFEPGHPSPVPAAIALFVAGPMWWDVRLWGIWLPAWLLGAVMIVLCVLLWPRVRPPVLRDPTLDTVGLDPDHARRQARQWRAEGAARRTGPSPVHVLIAIGPGGTPTGNMRKAIQYAALPSAIAGAGLLATKWIAYPLLSVEQQDSVLLTLIDSAAWEVAKWLLAAASLGLAWQHLPGRRGLTKSLPLALVYVTAPITYYAISRASNSLHDWIPLADAAMFVLVLAFISLRMDIAAQEDVLNETGKVSRFFAAYGITNLPSRLIELSTLVITALTIWGALTGSEASFPSIDPAQLSRK